ncbi:hypothetical protein DCAR_0415312 [Daucus carota subsp. sativus]|uniref:Uncharacterized protein n=1 Tax=Daucus carota subsp. sativus TaxID=79200 RepID=A0A165AAC0_DAUCS|nr:PREDICTED: uncharacterized protein LOC108217120 [Daucus carota subsp. sativus]WOG95982.1 hypothetical protein DCAR_0415312 [Daucus carota subsp. sativus]
MSKRVSFSYDSMAEDPNIFNKTVVTAKSLQHKGHNRRSECDVQSPESISSTTPRAFLAEKFLKRVGAKVTRALSIVSAKSSSRREVSSSNLLRSRSVALDSQRAEAVEDCIEFLNSSSSLHKSNSAS